MGLWAVWRGVVVWAAVAFILQKSWYQPVSCSKCMEFVPFHWLVKDIGDELGGLLTFILVPPLLHGNFERITYVWLFVALRIDTYMDM